MKHIKLLFAALSISTLLFSCAENQTPSWEKRYGNGDSTVYVHYIGDDGRQHDFFMDWLLFSSLYSHGGYGSCYGYYNTHEGYRYTQKYRNYSNYTSHTTTVNHNYIGGGSSKPSGFFKSSGSSHSYSSPSRSYSSPSRSYSSPSRSYSSPSRSYSSPSRSSSHYSSPSRH